MTTLLKIRFYQLKREFRDLGYIALLLPGLLWFLIFISYKNYQKIPEAFQLTGVLFLICLLLQLIRKDKTFVYTHLQNPRLELFVEYICFTFLFAAPALVTDNWYCFPILTFAQFLLTFLKKSIPFKTRFKQLSKLIPAQDFEWISGFRKSYYLFIPLYTLALGFSWFRIVPLALQWLITSSALSFYTENEDLHVLRVEKLGARLFLEEKMWRHAKMLLLLCAPIVLINTLFNLEYATLNLLFLVAQVALLCCAIVYKYALYQPNTKANGSSIVLSLISLCALLPYLLPIPIFMTFYYYQRAKSNLQTYLT
ncbi:MAG: hypothetical protein IPP32_12125 [Bacteroidetes bacterium]|nr:hypothetical protein [Bacteroidota bacterium]